MPEPAPERTPQDDTTHLPDLQQLAATGTTAPVTAEGLRERTCDGSRCGRHHPTENGNMMGGHDCCCGQPWLASYDHCMSEARRGDPVSPRDRIAAALRYEGGDLNDDHDVYDLANVAIAALAGDPGDLPARMAAAIAAYWESDESIHDGFEVSKAAAAALSVRWEHEAQLAVALEHAQAELSSRIEQHQRAVTRAIAAETERDELKASIETGSIAGFAADVRRLVADYSNEERGVIALTPFEAALDQLCLEKYGFDLDRAIAALDAPETPGDAVCSYQSEPWSCRGKRQWYVCTRPDGHDDDHQLCVATEG